MLRITGSWVHGAARLLVGGRRDEVAVGAVREGASVAAGRVSNRLVSHEGPS